MENHQPTAIVILGGGGDLAQRKLFPAFFDLYTQNKLSASFSIIGLARTKRTNEEYRELVSEAILHRTSVQADQVEIDAFCEHVTYLAGSFEEKESYERLRESIDIFESQAGTSCNKLFYLAVPPLHYESIFKTLHESGLAEVEEGASHWARILVEKPFGSNYESAQALDKTLGALFPEEQIFRIDHYLAKEAVQNILSFRFANTLLSSPWNSKHIKEVRITMFEKIDVGTRGSFYDGVGALRDVGQNHLLQILALIAMDEPEKFDALHIRESRVALLEKLRLMDTDTVGESAVRAQYEGYRGTAGVAENSDTETYFEFKAHIDTPVWENVPFYVRAGKAMEEEKVTVEIFFHDVATGPFETSASSTVGNAIVLTVSPEHAMHITLNVKKPGHGYQIESHTLSYTWDDASHAVGAYEKVLLDCLVGDQTLFTRTEEVLASWKFISSIMEHWNKVPLQRYAKGSAGPENTLSMDNRYL